MRLTVREQQQTPVGRLKLVAYTALILSIASMVFVVVLTVQVTRYYLSAGPSRSSVSLQDVTISGNLITPPSSLADAPPILAQQPFGKRLTNINTPLNSTELAIINDAPDAYFDTAARMYLNRSLAIPVGASVAASPLLTVNGKPSVVYLGAISCIFCGENRWAMALALSRFGSFQQLFKGYSAILDQDVPTLYWAPAHYNETSAVEFGNFYAGRYVTFLSIEYSSPITQGFQIAPLSYFQQQAATLRDPIYENATSLIIRLNNFAGTPYTVWGRYSVLSADSSNFGDPTTNSTSLPIVSMTHEQILSRFAKPNSPFAWTEYAAADFYAALVCASGGVSAPICSIPSISSMASQAKAAGAPASSP